MATATQTVLKKDAKMVLIQWNITSANPDGAPFIPAGHFTDISIQVFGTFGGGTIKLQGTNEVTAANWWDFVDVAGAAIGITAAGGKRSRDCSYQIRPLLSGGAAVNVTVIVCLRA